MRRAEGQGLMMPLWTTLSCTVLPAGACLVTLKNQRGSDLIKIPGAAAHPGSRGRGGQWFCVMLPSAAQDSQDFTEKSTTDPTPDSGHGLTLVHHGNPAMCDLYTASGLAAYQGGCSPALALSRVKAGAEAQDCCQAGWEQDGAGPGHCPACSGYRQPDGPGAGAGIPLQWAGQGQLRALSVNSGC